MINPTVTVVGSTEIADDNVSVWEKSKTYTVNTYYTSIDTVSNPAIITWQISAVYPEGDSVRINWPVPTLPATLKLEKVWFQNLQKWLAISTLTFNPATAPAQLPISASVTFINQKKSVSRDAVLTISQNKRTFDVFAVNFGMSREQVRINEIERLGSDNLALGGWTEHSPTLAELNKSATYGNFTFYEFVANQLKSVSITSSQSGVDNHLNVLVTKLKIPEAVNTGPLIKNYTWNNGKLKFTLHNKDFQLNTGAKKFVCLTFEKL